MHEKVRRCSGHGLILEEGVQGASEDDGGDCPPEFESGRDYGIYRGKLVRTALEIVGRFAVPRLGPFRVCPGECLLRLEVGIVKPLVVVLLLRLQNSDYSLF